MSTADIGVDLGRYKLGWSDEEDYVFKPKKGLNTDIITEMSGVKGEPQWMLDFRLKSYQRFQRRPRPAWGGDTSGIDFDDIYYYIKPTEGLADEWDAVPESIKNTYERLGIPEAERKYLAGVTAQYESEVVYHRNRADLEELGVLFCDMDTALREYPEIVKAHFGTVIPPNDNKFAALNSSVWSGGSFIYVPPGVEVDMPLQAYFRINAENMGQFERTLIIADEGSKVHYIEGCSAPTYSTDSLHSAVVEIAVGPSARVTYTTIQNWSDNVYNLVTKRARVAAEGHMEWIDGNIGCLAEGSRVTTPGGTKPIELVAPGDEVLSYDEAAGSLCWRRVTAKRYSGAQPVREVQAGSRRLRVTDNHPFYSYDYDPSRPKKLGRYNLAYVRADRLAQAIVPISSLDYGEPHKLTLPDAETEATTDELMRLFGLCMGEGGGGVTLAWNSVDLADLLEDNGFVTGALRKRVPDWVLDLPESQRLSFVAGYLDSDGCAAAGRRGFSIKSVNRDLLEGAAAVLTSLGISSRVTTEFEGERRVRILDYEATARGSHRLDFPADPRLVGRVSPELRAAAERQSPPTQRHFRRVGRSQIELPESVEIRSVQVAAEAEAEVVPTWDIEVEGTGNFVSEGFIVHNSRLTMKYPAVVMTGPKASGEVLSVAYAGAGQHQDTGAKMTHAAPETTSKIVSKSISKDGGRTSYRGLVRVEDDTEGCKSHVQCDALILDPDSVSDTYPYMEVGSGDAVIGHEATVSKVADEQLFYLQSRGLTEEQAMGMIVNGFIEPVTRTLPMEYAIEWSRLIELQMEGSVG